jgi:hypothetical protein
MNDQLRSLIREAVEAGFTVSRTSRGHPKFVAPNGSVVFGSGTPGDWRAIHNMRAKLRRVGLDDKRSKQRASGSA